nr:hypothetical protein [Acinetobacter lwoffii]
MTVHRNYSDILEKTLYEYSNRQLNFLCYNLNIYNNSEFIYINHLNKSVKISQLRTQIDYSQIDLNELNTRLMENLIDEEYFSCLHSNDLRQIIYLLYKHLPKEMRGLPSTNLYEYLQFTIDTTNKSIREKATFLSFHMWKYQNHATPENDLKWIDFKNSHQTSWIIKYLESKNLLLSLFLGNFSLRDQPSIIITSSLDCLFLEAKEKKPLLQRMSKSWSMQKFRDAGKTKTKHHLPLTKQAKRNLKKLALFKNKSESEILEELINESYLLEMCDDEGRALY